MTFVELLHTLRDRGVKIRATRGGVIRARGPASAIDAELLAAMRRHKATLRRLVDVYATVREEDVVIIDTGPVTLFDAREGGS